MKIEQVQKVLESENGAKAEGKGVYSIADDAELTVMIDAGQEPLSIPKVRKLTLQADLVTIETTKGDRIYTSAGIRALKFSASEASKVRGTGFLPGGR